jgi:hypothetical protein
MEIWSTRALYTAKMPANKSVPPHHRSQVPHLILIRTLIIIHRDDRTYLHSIPEFRRGVTTIATCSHNDGRLAIARPAPDMADHILQRLLVTVVDHEEATDCIGEVLFHAPLELLRDALLDCDISTKRPDGGALKLSLSLVNHLDQILHFSSKLGDRVIAPLQVLQIPLSLIVSTFSVLRSAHISSQNNVFPRLQARLLFYLYLVLQVGQYVRAVLQVLKALVIFFFHTLQLLIC